MRTSEDNEGQRAAARDLSADMFLSVDGFAAGADGSQAVFQGLGGPELGRYIQGVLNEPQIMVLGRVTYELLSTFWSASSHPPADRMNSLPKVVFSRSLSGALDWNARLAMRDLRAEVLALKQEPGDPLRVIGSLGLVRQMVGLGLVDRLRLVVFPRVLGAAGTQPMFDGYAQTGVELARSTVLDGNVLALEYRIAHAS